MFVFNLNSFFISFFQSQFIFPSSFLFFEITSECFPQSSRVTLSRGFPPQAGRRRGEANAVGHGGPGRVRRHHQGLLPRGAGLRACLLHHRQRFLRGSSLLEDEGQFRRTQLSFIYDARTRGDERFPLHIKPPFTDVITLRHLTFATGICPPK